MQDLQTFKDWMILSALKSDSTAQHYKSGLSACSKDFISWNLTDKPLMEMTLSELDVAIQKAFLSSLFIEKKYSRKQYLDLVKKQEKLEEVSSKSPYNYLEGLNPEYDYEFGVIACGIGYNYVKEADTDSCHIPVLKVSQYPLPAEEIRTMADRCGYGWRNASGDGGDGSGD